MFVLSQRLPDGADRSLKRIERFDLSCGQAAMALPDLASTHHAPRIGMHASGMAALLADMLARILYVTTAFRTHAILQSDFAGLALSSVRVSPGLPHIQSFAPVLDDYGQLRGKRAVLQFGDALDLLDFDGREFYVHGFELFSHGRIVNTSGINLSRGKWEPPQPTLEDRVFCGGLAQHEADLTHSITFVL